MGGLPPRDAQHLGSPVGTCEMPPNLDLFDLCLLIVTFYWQVIMFL